jgi:shikimate kinase
MLPLSSSSSRLNSTVVAAVRVSGVIVDKILFLKVIFRQRAELALLWFSFH